MSEPEKRGWFGRNWLWFCPAGCLGGVLVVGGGIAVLAWGVISLIRSTDAYTLALDAARDNPEVVEAIGEPIEAGILVSGNISLVNDAGDADISIPISGPKGSATVHAVAEKADGTWSYSVLKVRVDGSGEVIDLLPTLEETL